jgi:hypothetical protein
LQKELKPPYDFDAYAPPSLPVGEDLERQGAEAEKAGNILKSRELYFRAACVYRIGYFPFLVTAMQRVAWERQKIVYLKGAA